MEKKTLATRHSLVQQQREKIVAKKAAIINEINDEEEKNKKTVALMLRNGRTDRQNRPTRRSLKYLYAARNKHTCNKAAQKKILLEY